jgi:hypothetical protein
MFLSFDTMIHRVPEVGYNAVSMYLLTACSIPLTSKDPHLRCRGMKLLAGVVKSVHAEFFNDKEGKKYCCNHRKNLTVSVVLTVLLVIF